MMTKLLIGASVLLSLLPTSLAFAPLAALSVKKSSVTSPSSFPLCSTVESAPSDVEDITVEDAKSDLLSIVQKLKDQHGIQLIAKAPKKELKAAVEALEGLGTPSTDTSELMGNWTLLVTTASNREGVDTTPLESLPAVLKDPLTKIRSTILDTANKYLQVEQKILSTKGDGVIDRIDHVLELQPPSQLRDFLDNLPEQLMNVNINPLAVSKSKLVLIHKASIEDEGPPLKTKLELQSIVLNVAGSSRVLDPSGRDVAGINVPSLGDFINTADFETTYMDDDVRISRGKLGFVEQLRVFVRSEAPTIKMKHEEMADEEEIVDIGSSTTTADDDDDDDDSNIDAPSDVEGSDELTP